MYDTVSYSEEDDFENLEPAIAEETSYEHNTESLVNSCLFTNPAVKSSSFICVSGHLICINPISSLC